MNREISVGIAASLPQWGTPFVSSNAHGRHQDRGALVEALLGHIGLLLSDGQHKTPTPREEEGCEDLADALRRVLGDVRSRAVMELHLQAWLKEDPVKAWLWACYKAQDMPGCLDDAAYVAEMADLLAAVVPRTAQGRPTHMAHLLRCIMTCPWEYGAGARCDPFASDPAS